MSDDQEHDEPLRIEASALVFAPPAGLTIERLLRLARAAVSSDAPASDRTLHVEQVPGTGLVCVMVDEPAPVLAEARSWSQEHPGPVLAWEGEPHARQVVTLFRGGAPELHHDAEEAAEGTTDVPDLAFTGLVEDLHARGQRGLVPGAPRGPVVRVALDAPADVVATAQANLDRLLAGLPATRADDERRLVERAQRFVAEVTAQRAAPRPEAEETKSTIDPEALRAANQTVKVFLIVSGVIVLSLVALFAVLASRAPA